MQATVLPTGGQPVAAVPMQNVVILPQYVTPQPASSIWTNYASKSSSLLGVTQIAIGLLCILFNAVAIGADSLTAAAGHGIWGGLFFILTGTFGLMAGKLRNTCSIVTFMVFSILAACIFVMFVLVLAAIGVGFDDYMGRKFAKAMDAVLVALSLLEAVVAVWSSALGCSAVCCGSRSQSDIQGPVMMSAATTQVLYTTGTSYPQTGQMFQLQAIAAAVGQQQQFGGAPTNHIPQSTMSYPPPPTMAYPPQYNANTAPPPYAQTTSQGSAATAGPFSQMAPVVGDETKIAF